MIRAIIIVVTLAACHRTSPDELLRDSAEETRRFFALVEGGDCDQLQHLLARPELCTGLVTDFREQHAHLTQIEDTKIDGRDPQLVLVTVNVQSTRHLHTWIVRAKWTPTGWHFAL